MVWNPNKTNWEIQFDDLPLKQDITLKLLDWHTVLSTNIGNSNSLKIKCVAQKQFRLIDGDTIERESLFTLSLWSGIYTKWEKARKPNTSLNPMMPVEVVLNKQSNRKWRIKEVVQ